MIQIFIVVAILVVFEVASVRFGADSRDGDDWTFRRHNHPGGAKRLPG